MGENRAFLKLKLTPATGHFHDNVRPENIGGHQVGRELNAIERNIEHFAERPHEQRLSQAGDSFEQDVTAREQRMKRALHDRIMADDDFADFSAQGRITFAKRLELSFGAHNYFFKS